MGKPQSEVVADGETVQRGQAEEDLTLNTHPFCVIPKLKREVRPYDFKGLFIDYKILWKFSVVLEFHRSLSLVKGRTFSFAFGFLHALFMTIRLCYGHEITEPPFPKERNCLAEFHRLTHKAAF